MSNLDSCDELEISSRKEGVYKAFTDLNKGLYPGACCKIMSLSKTLPKDIRDKYVQIIHTSGIGTKGSIAYIAKKEGLVEDIYDLLVQDAIVMNIDEMASVGAFDEFFISNHISRNKNRINDEEIAKIIESYPKSFEKLERLGIVLYNAGGEVADVGSYISTMGLDVTASATIPKEEVIDYSKVKPYQVIVGLSSSGQSTYETKENSGIRCNDLTLASNILLHNHYCKYKEIIDDTINPVKQFRGCYYLEDKLEGTNLTIGEALLSPNRTYLPVLKKIRENGIKINGIIHCTDGGLTKSINFGDSITYVKDFSEFKIPPIFEAIQEVGNISDECMYQTFNMGIGMEIIVDNWFDAEKIIRIAESYNIEAHVIGLTEKSFLKENEVEIETTNRKLIYKKESQI